MYSFPTDHRETLLKQYIDAQFLVIRLEKLKNQASTRELNGSEVKELNDCLIKWKEIVFVGSVSKEENIALVDRAYNLFRAVQDLNFQHINTANQDADNERIVEMNKKWEIDRLKVREVADRECPVCSVHVPLAVPQDSFPDAKPLRSRFCVQL
jgi:hypothetical protein